MTPEQVWGWWGMAGDVVASLSPVIVFVLALGAAMYVGRAIVGFVVGLGRSRESDRPRDNGGR